MFWKWLFERLQERARKARRSRRHTPRVFSMRNPTDEEVIEAIKTVPAHYLQPPVVMGWQSELDIWLGFNSVLGVTGVQTSFGVRGGSIEFTSNLQECGDSITGIYEAHKAGRLVLNATADFYEKYNVPSFGVSGFAIGPGVELYVAFYPNGVSGNADPVKDPYLVPSFICASGRLTWNVDGKLEGSFSGKSNGPWFMPNN